MSFYFKKHIPLLGIIALVSAQMAAREVEIVPAWTVTVLDSAGKPVQGIKVDELWEFIGVKSSGSDGGLTDSAGTVAFSRHTVEVDESTYLSNKGLSKLNVHGSFGPTGSVRIHAKGQKSIRAYYSTDKKVYDDKGATTVRTTSGFSTTLRLIELDLFDCINSKDWSAVKRTLLEKPESISMRGRGEWTPLISIAWHGFSGQPAELIRLLIEKGADVNAQAKDGMTALHQMAANQDLAGIEFLLSKKADPNLKIHDSVNYSTNGFTPLHFQLGAYGMRLGSTSAADRIAGVDLLLKHGAEVNAKDAKGNTPLHLAAVYGDPEIVSALLTRGADSGAQNAAGQTPLESIKSLRDTPPVLKIKALLKPEQPKPPLPDHS